MTKTKIILIIILFFVGSLAAFKFTRAQFSDSETVLGNSIQVGVWGGETTPTPSETPILTPTEAPSPETPTSTPTETPLETPTPTSTPTPTPTNTPTLTQTPTPSTLPWTNEIHYDNVSTDTNEGVEIAGPAGFDLTGWAIVFYSGANGNSYSTLNLTGSIPNQQSGSGTLWFAKSEIQNGAPDGLALVAPGNIVAQFLSYEGSFIAANGPAAGMNSIDIVVDEEPPSPEGQSLQLQGTGNKYTDFTWANPIPSTYGVVNTGQTFN